MARTVDFQAHAVPSPTHLPSTQAPTNPLTTTARHTVPDIARLLILLSPNMISPPDQFISPLLAVMRTLRAVLPLVPNLPCKKLWAVHRASITSINMINMVSPFTMGTTHLATNGAGEKNTCDG